MIIQKCFFLNIRREVVINIVFGKYADVVKDTASNEELGCGVYLVEVQSAQLPEPEAKLLDNIIKTAPVN